MCNQVTNAEIKVQINISFFKILPTYVHCFTQEQVYMTAIFLWTSKIIILKVKGNLLSYPMSNITKTWKSSLNAMVFSK